MKHTIPHNDNDGMRAEFAADFQHPLECTKIFNHDANKSGKG